MKEESIQELAVVSLASDLTSDLREKACIALTWV